MAWGASGSAAERDRRRPRVSYGFRPGRVAHDAMDALCVGMLVFSPYSAADKSPHPLVCSWPLLDPERSRGD
jgi:hypothetical protein